MTLFDTDVLIDYLRGHAEAQREVLAVPLEERVLSAVTAMELLVGARDRQDANAVDSFTKQAFARVLPIDEAISTLALDLVKMFSLSHGLRIPDALIGATARSRTIKLVTGNLRHFDFIPGLDVQLPAYRAAIT